MAEQKPLRTGPSDKHVDGKAPLSQQKVLDTVRCGIIHQESDNSTLSHDARLKELARAVVWGDTGKKNALSSPQSNYEFTIGGVNETHSIHLLESINGITIRELEARMRPGYYSTAGFLGEGESLIPRLEKDNDKVKAMGLTHQKLANFLDSFSDAPNGKVKHAGKDFFHKVEIWRGPQESPFGDGTTTDRYHTIINLETGAGIHPSGLLREMIRRYGFYEGKETFYREEPEAIAKTADYIRMLPDDPVVQLVKDRDAHAKIQTSEQLKRVGNLHFAKVDVLSGRNYQVIPENLEVLFEFNRLIVESKGLEAWKKQVAAHVDTGALTPQVYRIEDDRSYKALTDVIPSAFPQFKEVVLDTITQLELVIAGDSERFLRTISDASKQEDHPHRDYFDGLSSKLPKDFQTPAEMRELRETVNNLTRFIHDIGGVKDARTQDVTILIEIVAKNSSDNQYTSAEQAAMGRLKVNPELIPYAREIAFHNSPSDMIIQQLYNGAAEQKRDLVQFMQELPDNIEKQAKKAIGEIFKHLRSSYSKEVDVDKFKENIINRAKDSHGGFTEADVLNGYVKLACPEFGEFLSHPLVKKSLGGGYPLVNTSLDMEAVNALQIDTFVKDTYNKKVMRYITIKGEKYLISESNIYKGEYKKHAAKLSIGYRNNSVSLSLKYEY